MSGEPLLILGATVLGGAISFLTTYGMARLAQRQAELGAARLAIDDLGSARELLVGALRTGEWSPPVSQIATAGWESVRPALAAVLTQEQLAAVTSAFEHLKDINVLDVPSGRLQPTFRNVLEESLVKVVSALHVLVPYFWDKGRKAGFLERHRAKRRRAEFAEWDATHGPG
jgi:hypothetical protein